MGSSNIFLWDFLIHLSRKLCYIIFVALSYQQLSMYVIIILITGGFKPRTIAGFRRRQYHCSDRIPTNFESSHFLFNVYIQHYVPLTSMNHSNFLNSSRTKIHSTFLGKIIRNVFPYKRMYLTASYKHHIVLI